MTKIRNIQKLALQIFQNSDKKDDSKPIFIQNYKYGLMFSYRKQAVFIYNTYTAEELLYHPKKGFYKYK